MRRAARIDDNQQEIVKGLRKAGCNVLSLAAVGDGVPDLLVHRVGVLTLMEVKDGTKKPSARRLTRHQIRFHRDWPSTIVFNLEDALKAVGL